MTHNSPVYFKSTHFLLWIKGSHQSPNYETFDTGENLLNSSCHFSNHKSVFLKILHHSSVSWKITPLYFFSSNFGQKEPIKVQIFEIFKCLYQNSSCQFWNNKLIPPQTFHHSSVSSHVTPLYFQIMHFLLCTKGSHQSPNFHNFKFLVSFSRPQVSFSSNFAWLFSVMKGNSFVLL